VLAGNYRPSHGAHKQVAADGFLLGYSLLSLWRNVTEANFLLVFPEEAGKVGTPPDDTAIALPFRGVVTKYQPGVLGLDGKPVSRDHAASDYRAARLDTPAPAALAKAKAAQAPATAAA
jgi:hypothetical protein